MPAKDGMLIMETTGSMDTYMELYDGGESLDSRLSVRLQPGVYYLKVECLDDEPDEPYTISITAE
jgi:hypothetical protein